MSEDNVLKNIYLRFPSVEVIWRFRLTSRNNLCHYWIRFIIIFELCVCSGEVAGSEVRPNNAAVEEFRLTFIEPGNDPTSAENRAETTTTVEVICNQGTL